MSKVIQSMFNRIGLFAAVLGLLAMPAMADSGTSTKAEIDAGVKEALLRFAKEISGGQEFLNTAKGVLVFPKIYKGGIVVGGEYGEGALQVGGKSVDYYSSGGVSVGFQLGAQAKTVVIAFMTTEALEKFHKKNDGWKVGVDGSVALVDMGAGKSLDSNTIKDPVVGFVFGQKGLMYNLTLEGTGFKKIDPK